MPLNPSRKKVIFISILIALTVLFGVLFFVPSTSAVGISSLLALARSAFAPPEAKILIVGDMMFDRYIRLMNKKHGSDFLFACIDPLLNDADFVVGNLEGPITKNPSVSAGSVVGSPENYQFTFPTSTASLLFQHNIKLVNLGNNHINNFGREGISATKEYLSKAEVSYFGGLIGDAPIYRVTEHGIEISFVNYNQFGGQSVKKVAEAIASEHASGRKVIVYAHWGEEYVDVSDSVRRTAKLFADNGADLIVGSHPHVVQSHEMIGTTPVYYSLGNFIFDQYWNTKVTSGLGLLVHVSKDGISVEEKPVHLSRDGRTCPV